MARKVFTDMNTQQDQQFDLMSLYISKKQQADKLDKEVKELGELVKKQMYDKGVSNVECDGYKITKTESQRMVWKPELLLAKVKTYNMPELIKLEEQVNMEQLESCILDGVINTQDLLECQKTTDIVSLRITKVKEVQQ